MTRSPRPEDVKRQAHRLLQAVRSHRAVDLLPSVLSAAAVLIVWFTLAPALWRAATTLATQPGGGYALFHGIGTLWLITLLTVDMLRARRHADATLPLGSAHLPNLTTPADVLRRRALHEAAHAVASWAMGGRVISLDIQPIDSRGGQCIFALDGLEDATAKNWAHLVACMAGNQVDLAHGHHDDGAQADLLQALAAAAAIISTGRCPRGLDVELTTDALLGAARTQADLVLAQHQHLLDRVVQRLLHRPNEPWHDPDLAALTDGAPLQPAGGGGR